jgi:CheY-like chemotaxis protein
MGSRILVVEDEQIVVEDLKRKLARMGHEVVGSASSGVEAIRLAAELQPSVVLMDIRLHGPMDGREAAKCIQKTKPTPIIYITAYGSDVFQYYPLTEMQPPAICISKPFSYSQLRTMIDVALSSPDRPTG